MRKPRLLALAGAGALCTSVSLGALAFTTDGASAAPTYSAVASAEGLRASVLAQNGPVTNTPIDFGGPVAQSTVDSLGVSRSFASHPYPGELPVSGPGLVAGVSGGALNLPTYPWYVNAEHPAVPERSYDQGGVHLTAKAAERASSAAATSGAKSDQATAGFAGASAVTEATPDGAVRSSATSELSGVAVGPLVIGRLLASAETTRDPGGTVVKHADLTGTGLTVGGISVVVTPKGLAVGDTRLPAADTAAVQRTLDEAGMKVRYLAGREDATGVVSPALEISYTRPIDSPVTRGGVIIVFGAAAARVDGAGAVEPPPADLSGSNPSAGPNPNPGATAPPAGTAAVASGNPAGQSGPFDPTVGSSSGQSFEPGNQPPMGPVSVAMGGESTARPTTPLAPSTLSVPTQTAGVETVPAFQMKSAYAVVGLAAGLMILTVSGFGLVRPQREE
jgi:hypothetical protein